MNFFYVTFYSLMLGAPLYLPWLFIRFGRYKIWYLALTIPAVSFGRALYAWPASAMFVAIPMTYVLDLLGVESNTSMGVTVIIGIIGWICAIWMIIWTPDWAKPFWQRHLESAYSYQEIQEVFLPVWRKMYVWEWSKKMETKEGIEELVAYARKEHKGMR